MTNATYEVMFVKIPNVVDGLHIKRMTAWEVRVYVNEVKVSNSQGFVQESTARLYLDGVLKGLSAAGIEPVISEGEELVR